MSVTALEPGGSRPEDLLRLTHAPVQRRCGGAACESRTMPARPAQIHCPPSVIIPPRRCSDAVRYRLRPARGDPTSFGRRCAGTGSSLVRVLLAACLPRACPNEPTRPSSCLRAAPTTAPRARCHPRSAAALGPLSAMTGATAVSLAAWAAWCPCREPGSSAAAPLPTRLSLCEPDPRISPIGSRRSARWSFDEVLAEYRALEADADFGDDWHGRAGPVPIRRFSLEELLPEHKAARTWLP